jgi:multicomponent Na+:H+ antiporter subunit A
VKHLLVVDRSVRVVFHAVLLGSLYLLFAGHNQPGGGFVGGLVAGAALAMRYVAGGIEEVRRLTRLQPWTILGSGLLLAAGTAIAPLLVGRTLLDSGAVSWDLPVFGKLKATTALPFDVGVYLLVVGVVLMVFEAFGDDAAAGASP